MTTDQKIAALQRWPRILARSFIGRYAPDVRPTYTEWLEACEQFEEVICGGAAPAKVLGGIAIGVFAVWLRVVTTRTYH